MVAREQTIGPLTNRPHASRMSAERRDTLAVSARLCPSRSRPDSARPAGPDQRGRPPLCFGLSSSARRGSLSLSLMADFAPRQWRRSFIVSAPQCHSARLQLGPAASSISEPAAKKRAPVGRAPRGPLSASNAFPRRLRSIVIVLGRPSCGTTFVMRAGGTDLLAPAARRSARLIGAGGRRWQIGRPAGRPECVSSARAAPPSSRPEPDQPPRAPLALWADACESLADAGRVGTAGAGTEKPA